MELAFEQDKLILFSAKFLFFAK